VALTTKVSFFHAFKVLSRIFQATEPPKVIPKITTPPIHKAVNEVTYSYYRKILSLEAKIA
jgi:hypothetical protein